MPRAKSTGRRLRRDKENRKNSCGIIITYANGKRVMCGRMMLGKIRYCMNCSINLKKESSDENM